MSVADELGISCEEWAKLEEPIQAKLIKGQAKLMAMRDLTGHQVIEDDDRDIRKRTQVAFDSMMGRDANQCKDPPHEEKPADDMRVTVLGDVQGDTAVNWLHQQTQSIATDGGKVVTPPPEPKPVPVPQPKITPWYTRLAQFLIPLAVGAALTASGYWIFGPEAIDPTRYEMFAVPYEKPNP